VFAVLVGGRASAEDLVSPSYRLRGLHVSASGPAWLESTAPSPSILGSGVSAGQSPAIGYSLPAAGLELSWAGFWPLAAGELPNHDLDGDDIPSLVDLDDDGDGAPDAVELAGNDTDPLDPDSDDDELCDGPPSALPACAQGAEDLDGDGVWDVGFETDPTDPDTDDDDWHDGREIEAGTDPLDPSSHPFATLLISLQPVAALLLTGVLGLIGSLRLRRLGRGT
jgi:hypothetical protein